MGFLEIQDTFSDSRRYKFGREDTCFKPTFLKNGREQQVLS